MQNAEWPSGTKGSGIKKIPCDLPRQVLSLVYQHLPLKRNTVPDSYLVTLADPIGAYAGHRHFDSKALAAG